MKIDKYVYNPLNNKTVRRCIVQGVALTLFVVLMALAPTLSDKYDLWVHETNTPIFFRLHPYLFALVSAIAIFCAFVFYVFATVREKRKMSRLEKRLDKLEKKV